MRAGPAGPPFVRPAAGRAALEETTMAEHTHVPAGREGSLEAPTRHPLDWRNPDFFDEESLFKELERVFDICHGCRRCFSLCNSFPTAVRCHRRVAAPANSTASTKKVYWEVVDHCYLCDMCYMTKCPYVPPHPWNIDFPHLMLRAKAVQVPQGRDAAARQGADHHRPGRPLAGIPVVSQVVNAVNRQRLGRKLLEKTLGVHPRCADARVPQRLRRASASRAATSRASRSSRRPRPRGKVALFTTCYGNRNEPEIGEDLAAVFRAQRHPGVGVADRSTAAACPSSSSAISSRSSRRKDVNIPALAALVRRGLRHRRADPLLRADVQAGTAADVPGRPAGAEGQGGASSTRSST